MKENKLSIRINRPVHKVFAYTINPENTPTWIDGIVKEEVDRLPVQLGSIYRNIDRGGKWTTYKVTQFEQDKSFEMRDENSDYGVRYTYAPLDNNSTQLNYFEWVETGYLKILFSLEVLQKLKYILEKS